MTTVIDWLPILDEDTLCNDKSKLTKLLAKTDCTWSDNYAWWIDVSDLALDPADIIQIIVDYFSAAWVQAPTALEVCAYLNSLQQQTTIDWTTKIVLWSCEYGTVNDLVTYLSSVISIDDQQITSSGNTISLTNGWTANIVNSNVLSSTWLVLTSTINWVADSEDIEPAVQALIDASTDSVTNTVVGHKIADHTAVDGTTVAINETVTSLSNGSVSWTVLSIPFTDENWVTTNSNTDLAPLMSSAVFQSNDDQVLTAGANSDMDVQLVPTIVADPDSQVNKTNYEISITPKTTVICSGSPLSATNKLLTSDTLTANVTVPTTVTATPDPLTTPYTKAVKVNVGCNEDVYVPDTLWSLPVLDPVNKLCPVDQATTFVWQDYVRNNAWVLEVYSPRHRVITNAAFNPTAPTVWDLNATVTDWCGFTWEVDCQGNVVFTWGQKQYRQMDVWNSADDTFPFNSTDTSWNWFDLYISVFSLSVNMCVPVLPLWYRAYFSWNIVESWFSIEFANTAWVLRHITGLGFDSWYIDRTIDMTSSWMDIRNNIERIPLVISWWLVNWTNNFQVFMEYRVDNWIAPFNTWWSMYWYVYWFDWILSIVRS